MLCGEAPPDREEESRIFVFFFIFGIFFWPTRDQLSNLFRRFFVLLLCFLPLILCAGVCGCVGLGLCVFLDFVAPDEEPISDDSQLLLGRSRGCVLPRSFFLFFFFCTEFYFSVWFSSVLATTHRLSTLGAVVNRDQGVRQSEAVDPHWPIDGDWPAAASNQRTAERAAVVVPRRYRVSSTEFSNRTTPPPPPPLGFYVFLVKKERTRSSLSNPLGKSLSETNKTRWNPVTRRGQKNSVKKNPVKALRTALVSCFFFFLLSSSFFLFRFFCVCVLENWLFFPVLWPLASFDAIAVDLPSFFYRVFRRLAPGVRRTFPGASFAYSRIHLFFSISANGVHRCGRSCFLSSWQRPTSSFFFGTKKKEEKKRKQESAKYGDPWSTLKVFIF